MQNLQQLGAAALPQLQQIAGQVGMQQLPGAVSQFAQAAQALQQAPQMLQSMPQAMQQGQQFAQQVVGQQIQNQMARMMPPGMPMPMPLAPPAGHGCPKCDRGSRVMVYISLLTLAILLLVFASVQSFGWSLMWFVILLIGYAVSAGIFL